jgi:hypothetical protein
MAIAAVALASRMPEDEDFPRATVAPANYEENSQTDVIMKRNPGRIARESRCALDMYPKFARIGSPTAFVLTL